MRVGVLPESLLERLALRADMVALPMAEGFGGMATSRILSASARLGIYELLAKGPQTAEEVARALNLDPEATYYLLLCQCRKGGALNRNATQFSLTPRFRPWLDPASDRSVVNYLKMLDDMWQIWVDLPAMIRQGARPDAYQGLLRQTPSQARFAAHDLETLRRHLLGLRDLARLQSPEIIQKLGLPRGRGRGWTSGEGMVSLG